MEARTACDHVHAVDKVELLIGEAEFVDVELAGTGKAADKRVAHHARLLEDLLEHEVGIAALLRHVDVPVDMRDGGLDGVAVGVGVGDALRRETGELAVFEHHDVARRIDHRDDVGGHVAAGLTLADDDGAILAGDGDHAGLVGTNRGEAVGTNHVRTRLAYGSEQIVRAGLAVAALVCLLNEVSEDLGVGVAREVMTARLELFTELGEVLDDTVVDNGDATIAARVRMCVRHGGTTVRRPARVADAAG